MITVSEALDFYRSESINVVDKARLEAAIENIKWVLGHLALSDVGVIICRTYLEARRASSVKRHGELHPTSDATVARELGVLKAAANCCLKWKKIKSDEIPTFEIPRNLPKKEIWLFKDEMTKLISAAQKHSEIMYVFIALLYKTASRRTAIEQLEWSQIDLDRNIIYLNKPGQRVTKKRRPTVPVKAMNLILAGLYPKKNSQWLFGSKTDRYKEFRQVLKMANLETVAERDGRPAGRVTPHTIRHTRATHLLEKGMSIYAVAQLLGDNATTVERVYGHACTSKLQDELEKFS